MTDTGHHDRRLARRLEDPAFRAEYERAGGPAPEPTSTGLVPTSVVIDEYAEVVTGEVVNQDDGRYAYADPVGHVSAKARRLAVDIDAVFRAAVLRAMMRNLR